jgi:hypothetical protein
VSTWAYLAADQRAIPLPAEHAPPRTIPFDHPDADDWQAHVSLAELGLYAQHDDPSPPLLPPCYPRRTQAPDEPARPVWRSWTNKQAMRDAEALAELTRKRERMAAAREAKQRKAAGSEAQATKAKAKAQRLDALSLERSRNPVRDAWAARNAAAYWAKVKAYEDEQALWRRRNEEREQQELARRWEAEREKRDRGSETPTHGISRYA